MCVLKRLMEFYSAFAFFLFAVPGFSFDVQSHTEFVMQCSLFNSILDFGSVLKIFSAFRAVPFFVTLSLPLRMFYCYLCYVFPFHRSTIIIILLDGGIENTRSRTHTNVFRQNSHQPELQQIHFSMDFMTRWATHLIVNSAHSILFCSARFCSVCRAMCSAQCTVSIFYLLIASTTNFYGESLHIKITM